MFLAHVAADGRTQTVIDHLKGTAAKAKEFADAFGAGELAYEIGMAHDIGKYSAAFQKRIRGENVTVDHSTAGAQKISEYFGMPAAYCVAGHHGGLPNGGGDFDDASSPTLCGRLKRQVEDFGAFSDEVELHRTSFRPPQILGNGGFTMSFWIRMLFSCLVDADFLDTESFMLEATPPRGGGEDVKELLCRVEQYVSKWWDTDKELNKVRCDILHACFGRGKTEQPGLFTLTVPTGGGKTVSSLAFALSHAAAHGKKRVVYVIPYTSIIEQTADTFRKILGSDAVLEHHSNVDFDFDESVPEEERERKKAACENWDAPVIVTTAVQFFESLFANRPSRCRKLHNLAESVIIFDEAQTLPLPQLLPCIRAISELVMNYGASCVLCTATQPALAPLFTSVHPGLAAREIAPQVPQQVFRRVKYKRTQKLSAEELAKRLNGHSQVLCIVNTRKQAQAVYNLLDGEGSFHLSTLMTPAHRRKALDEIRKRLEDGEICRVVSTNLIEAGVDIDFPVVYREEAGLDSIVQAAGRCNREGSRNADESFVYVFCFDGEAPRLPHAMRRPAEVMRAVMNDGEGFDRPENVESYFSLLLRFTGTDADRLQIVRRFEDGVKKPGRPSFPFAEAADDFHLIEQNTCVVFIPSTDEAKELLCRLQNGERSRQLLRKASQHSVNVYKNHYDALCSVGALRLLDNDLAVLTDEGLYDENTGLSMQPDGGAGIFIDF